MEKRTILTTSKRGLLLDSLPFRLYQKAKRFGIWNPADFDFTQDVKDWNNFTNEQREAILRLISQFQAGEEAVTRDLLPLMMVIAKEGRLEEEMFLTTFLFEEAKHTEFFRLLLNALGVTGDLSIYHSNTYNTIFNEILPTSLERLEHDHSPEALAEASTVYNMFVEGVLAETGYYSFYKSLEGIDAMPSLLKGIGYLKKDEGRHIAYGTFLLQRLISEHPHIFDIVSKKMEELTPLAIQLNQEGRVEESPFGVDFEDTMNFTMKQLTVRMDILAKSRGQKLDDIYKQQESEFGVV
ncbi:R2-like ligand-binding oxidase [Bacillus sp. V5-8f]|uniref:R2-like ligand-binding oxidase n=1 Tax=Bacillus sp. V5-8f TaxID=2053044 RepID=UPI000C777904|nr:R2-like ligand-binding oxidase [Bacillus sp. V5-8f]PLT35545.1 ribonucleotide-diphosphate reductase [Bacillus sp. V5-8f]